MQTVCSLVAQTEDFAFHSWCILFSFSNILQPGMMQLVPKSTLPGSYLPFHMAGRPDRVVIRIQLLSNTSFLLHWKLCALQMAIFKPSPPIVTNKTFCAGKVFFFFGQPEPQLRKCPQRVGLHIAKFMGRFPDYRLMWCGSAQSMWAVPLPILGGVSKAAAGCSLPPRVYLSFCFLPWLSSLGDSKV